MVTVPDPEYAEQIHVQMEAAHLDFFIEALNNIFECQLDEDRAMMQFVELGGAIIYRERQLDVVSPLNMFAAGEFLNHSPTKTEALSYLLLWDIGYILQSREG